MNEEQQKQWIAEAVTVGVKQAMLQFQQSPELQAMIQKSVSEGVQQALVQLQQSQAKPTLTKYQTDVLADLKAGLSPSEISAKHKNTPQAVRNLRLKLINKGLLPPDFKNA
jgi:DNA-binding NarL/FixJ family response regulator